VLLKTYEHVYYYHVPDGNYYSHMAGMPTALPYTHEPQGEAVCWQVPGAAGYYTISEGRHQPVYYYHRTSSPDIVG